MPDLSPACVVDVPMADGARVRAFVYAPEGVRDEPGTPFAVTWREAPVVVLHGNGESHEHMAAVVDPFARARSVIALDSRGQGASSRGAEPLSYELMAADALEAMSRLGVTQAHVLGFSDGGIEALLMAREAPARVLSLTVIGANLTPEGLSREARRGMAARLRELGEGDGLAVPGEAGASGDGLAVPGGTGARAGAPVVSGGAALRTPPSADDRYGEAELLRLMLEQPRIDTASLARVRCPAAVLTGERDCVERSEGEAISESLAAARLVVVSAAGHDLPVEAPDAVVREAERVMAEGERPVRERPLVSREDGAVRVMPGGEDVAVLRATAAQEAGVLAMYERLLDSCEEDGAETCGWRRGFWPLPHDVSRRLLAGETWVAVERADVEGSGGEARVRPEARVLGAMSLDADLGLPGVSVGWHVLPEGAALTCHLLAVDPTARGRGVATALLAAYAREGLRRGCAALRINTSPQNLSNRLYREMGFALFEPVYFPYAGLDLTPWTNVYELRLDGAR